MLLKTKSSFPFCAFLSAAFLGFACSVAFAENVTLFEGSPPAGSTQNIGANDVYDYSGLTNSMTVGYTQGTGKIRLGSKNLQLGSGAYFDGVISDDGVYGGTGGSLTIAATSVTLTGANTFTGGTTINNVVLNLGDGRMNHGNFLASPITLNGNASLVYEFTDNPTTGGITSPSLSGTGSLQKFDSGTLTLSATSYTGGTVVGGGTLISADNSTAFGSANGNLIVNSPNNPVSMANVVLTFSEAAPVHTFKVGALGGQNGVIYGAATGTVILVVGNGYTGNDSLQENSYLGIIQDGPGSVTGLTKTGPGTQFINGSHISTYTGPTRVEQGVLSIYATLGSTEVTVDHGAVLAVFDTINNAGKSVSVFGKLAGYGTIAGNVTVNSGGLLSPGSATLSYPSKLTLNGLVTLSSGSSFMLDLNGAPASPVTTTQPYDQIFSSAGFTLDGDLSINLLNGFVPSMGQKFFVLNNTSDQATTTGSFANDVATSASTGTFTANGVTYAINYADNGDSGSVPNDVSLTVVPASVPEPMAFGFLAVGAILCSSHRVRVKTNRRRIVRV